MNSDLSNIRHCCERSETIDLYQSPSYVSFLPLGYIRIPSSVSNFRNMLPTIRLSPLRSPIIRKYTKPFNAFKRRGMYPNGSKCNAKRCVCAQTTITSSVNGRQFSIIKDNDMD